VAFSRRSEGPRLTDQGRRGAPARVETVAGNVIEKALEQTRRAGTYMMEEGGRSFAMKDGAGLIERLPIRLDGVTEIIVTFERMDPLAMLGTAVVGQGERSVWIVSIADLLMVADVLTDAGSFHHYARTRAATTAAGPVIYVESDGLGAYLQDRLAGVRAEANDNPDAIVVLGYASGDINEFFTNTELGLKSRAPTTGVPSSIAEALTLTIGHHAGSWTHVVDEVMAAPRDTWKRWRSFSRKHWAGGAFELSSDVALSTGPLALLTRADGTLELRIPRGRGRGGRGRP
jgi:hypothetical protein